MSLHTSGNSAPVWTRASTVMECMRMYIADEAPSKRECSYVGSRGRARRAWAASRRAEERCTLRESLHIQGTGPRVCATPDVDGVSVAACCGWCVVHTRVWKCWISWHSSDVGTSSVYREKVTPTSCRAHTAYRADLIWGKSSASDEAWVCRVRGAWGAGLTCSQQAR